MMVLICTVGVENMQVCTSVCMSVVLLCNVTVA